RPRRARPPAQPGFVPARDQDAGARLRETASHRLPEPAASTGDEGRASREIERAADGGWMGHRQRILRHPRARAGLPPAGARARGLGPEPAAGARGASGTLITTRLAIRSTISIVLAKTPFPRPPICSS